MAENSEQAVVAHDHEETDLETASVESNMRKFHCVAASVLVFTVAVFVFSITLFHINTPTFRLDWITIDELRMVRSSNTIAMKVEAQVSIENTNFGYFGFEATSVGFFYKGAGVVALEHGDELVIEEGRVGARSTKKITFSAEMGTASSISVGDDVACRCLSLTCKATMNGTIHFMKLIQRRRSSHMDCTITISFDRKAVLDVKCK